jgi:DNA-binding beta-propeller fold protein YncE
MTAQLATLRPSLRSLFLAALCVAGLALGAAAPAQANRPLIKKNAVETKNVPGGGIEGACGVALSGGNIYVSDYYHHAVDVFSSSTGQYQSQILGNPLNGPCGLATSASGALYANDWHQSVSRLLPSNLSFDSEESTGVAVDQASGNVYVNDRSYVAVYEPSGTAVTVAGEPLKIGLGTLGDGYGVAVSAGRVYVPDAADNTVKVYEPATDPLTPSSVIDGAAVPGGGFSSLVDAAVAVDPGTGHLLVLDNLQPGFEHPEGAVDEFGAAGEFLGQVSQKVIDGEPSGLVVDGSTLYVTSGNDEGANVFTFGPYTVSGPLATESPALEPSQQVAATAEPAATVAGPPAPIVATQGLRLLPSVVGARGSSVTIGVVAPGPGTLSVAGAGLRAQRALPIEAGKKFIRLHLNAAGKRSLARAKLRKLKVKLRVTLTPSDGAALSASTIVTFKAMKRGTQ